MASHLTVCICHGAKKHMMLVTEDTTIEDLAGKVWVEVFGEYLPEDDSIPLSSLVCFIFRGRKLSTPHLTLGALHVKNGERIMVLPNKNFYGPTGGHTSSTKQSSSQKRAEQTRSAAKEDNIHPAFRDLNKLGLEISSCENLVEQLSREVRASMSAGNRGQQEQQLQKYVKTMAASNEEHMKLLLRLDAIQTGGDSSIRSERKALVVRVQSGIKALDKLSSAVNCALKGDFRGGLACLDSQQ